MVTCLLIDSYIVLIVSVIVVALQRCSVAVRKMIIENHQLYIHIYKYIYKYIIYNNLNKKFLVDSIFGEWFSLTATLQRCNARVQTSTCYIIPPSAIRFRGFCPPAHRDYRRHGTSCARDNYI